MKLTTRNDQVTLKASQNLISLVENMGTGENLPVGKKVKFEPWKYQELELILFETSNVHHKVFSNKKIVF